MWYGNWLEETKWMWLASFLLAAFILAIAFLRKCCLELRINLWTGALIVLILTGMLKAYGFSDERLVQRQLELQRSVGHKSLNQKLYNLLRNRSLNGQIASEHWPLGALPELKKHDVMQAFPAGFSYEGVESLRRRNPEIEFLLFSQEHWANSVRARILSEGYSLLAVDTGFCLVAVPEGG
jgi:hypothetical protein